MGHSLPVSILMFGTIAAALGLAIIMLVRFMRRHDNHPMDGIRERNIKEIRDGKPPQR